VLELRDYQNVLIEGARANIRAGVKRQVLVAPTGSGKTVLAAFMQGSVARAWRSILVRRAPQGDNRTDFDDVSAGRHRARLRRRRRAHQSRPLVHLCGVQTLANRLADLEPPELIVWDECHHVAPRRGRRSCSSSRSLHIGLSATPERLDGKGLKEFFDRLVVGPTTGELIRRGFLAPYRYFAPAQPT
jgi:DNA repair protein RadD